jgi:type II secretory pathway pseudopilin PulG
MLIVVVVIGILIAAITPKISTLTARNKASAAAEMIQRDLERAFAIAARLRKPVQIVADNSALIYRVIDASGGTVRISRRLDGAGEFGVQTMTFSPTTVTVNPNGVASDSLAVTLTSMGATRRVSMTRVGLVRRSQ